MSSRVWFITGASSGFGRTLTELVLSKGEVVIATLRKPEMLDDLKVKYPSEKLLVLKLDVSKSSEISDAFRKAKEVYGRIDVVFNNAGYGILGEVEGTPEDVARAMFDVNFWGLANVSREAVTFFREVNPPGVGGRLLNVSSIAGVKTSPVVAYYSASKHAVEGLTKALSEELDPEWNIKVTLLEFGTFSTKGRDNSVHLPAHPAYTKPTLVTAQRRAWMSRPAPRRGDPEKGIQKVYELASLDHPPLHLPLGKDTIGAIRSEAASIAADVDKYESWSDDLMHSD